MRKRCEMVRLKSTRNHEKPRKKPGADGLHKKDWVKAARKLLIKSGISSVKIEPLAKTMSVTTGSFYWHFSGRKELYEALLNDWYDTNTAPLFDAVAGAGVDPRRQYLAFFGVWVLERDFDPKYDQAIRDWARTSKPVADLLREVDGARIKLLCDIYENFGYSSGVEAEMRARVTYYHQVGYYAMYIREPRARRLELVPYYADILTGLSWAHELSDVEQTRAAMLGDNPFSEDWSTSEK